MKLDYKEIGSRIARRRKMLGLKQAQVCERAEINDKYLSSIERAVSIPSLEVLMRLADALETTPDEFLVGTAQHEDDWLNTAEKLRGLNPRQLRFVENVIRWVKNEQM